MNESKQKIALFIDADNAPASKFEDVLSEVAKYGVVRPQGRQHGVRQHGIPTRGHPNTGSVIPTRGPSTRIHQHGVGPRYRPVLS